MFKIEIIIVVVTALGIFQSHILLYMKTLYVVHTVYGGMSIGVSAQVQANFHAFTF